MNINFTPQCDKKSERIIRIIFISILKQFEDEGMMNLTCDMLQGDNLTKVHHYWSIIKEIAAHVEEFAFTFQSVESITDYKSSEVRNQFE